jgi:8-hydroxy-5-deazaflavin:NADPH oxidoreductase
MKLCIIGFGSVGRNLSELAAQAGVDVTIGVRSPAATSSQLPICGIEDAVRAAELVLLAVPFRICAQLLLPLAGLLAGKTIIDATNPLNEDWTPMVPLAHASAAEEIAALLPQSHIVKAFNTIFADIMVAERLDRSGRRATAFLAGNDADAKLSVSRLASLMGFNPLDVGPLAQARYLEAMAHLNIGIAIGQEGGTNAAFLYDQVPAGANHA